MQTPDFFIGLTVLGITAIGAGVYLGKSRGEGAQPPPMKPVVPKINHKEQSGQPLADDVEDILLAEASDIWTSKVIPLAKAASIWVEPEEDKNKDIVRPTFEHEKINLFCMEMIDNKKNIYGAKKALIISILSLLDKMGDCPSVVRNPKLQDTDNKRDEDVFKMLAEIPLYEHSMSVAVNMVKRVGAATTLIPEAIIVSLGHDLGKIPAYHERGYSTGDHALISEYIIQGLDEYKALSPRNQSEITTIIKRHHDLNPSHPIVALLKESDSVTRNMETAAKMKESVARATQQAEILKKKMEREEKLKRSEVSEEIINSVETVPVNFAEIDHKPVSTKQIEKEAKVHAVQPAQHTPVAPKTNSQQNSSENKYTPKRVEIDWFNCDAYLAEMKNWINVVDSGRWGAVSQPDGLVYVNGVCLWGVVKKTASEDIKPVLFTADADEALKRDLLFSIVWTLSEQRQAIAADMIHPDYYMIPVTIISGSGKPVANANGSPTLMTPFRAEAFGVLPSDLENTKESALRKMVKAIKPKSSAR